MIEANNVSLTYSDGTIALKEVNLDIKPGELVYISGSSGSGKTSLLKLLIGMEYPTGGTLNVMNQSMKKSHAYRIRQLRTRIGPVFQEFKLIKGRTALDNVILGMRFLGISPRKMREYAWSGLERVGLDHKAKTLVEHLSWGESQRVAIARAVARKPSIILADEPTGNLDQANALNILKLLTSFKDQNTTVIITTHATHLIEGQKNATFIQVDSGKITVEKR
jgi:cell division transport system ATP-binding protein